MTTSIIPTATDAFYSEVVNLDGTNYKLTFTYNQRENCYYLSMATPEGEDILNGIKLVANVDLLSRWADPRLPPGTIMCCSNTATPDPPPGLGQIGSDGQPFTLVYFTRDSLP